MMKFHLALSATMLVIGMAEAGADPRFLGSVRYEADRLARESDQLDSLVRYSSFSYDAKAAVSELAGQARSYDDCLLRAGAVYECGGLQAGVSNAFYRVERVLPLAYEYGQGSVRYQFELTRSAFQSLQSALAPVPVYPAPPVYPLPPPLYPAPPMYPLPPPPPMYPLPPPPPYGYPGHGHGPGYGHGPGHGGPGYGHGPGHGGPGYGHGPGRGHGPGYGPGPGRGHGPGYGPGPGRGGPGHGGPGRGGPGHGGRR